MEVPQSQQHRKPRYPWFSFMLPIGLFAGLAIATIRIFPLLDSEQVPFILSGFVFLMGVAIAGGVYSSYKLMVLTCKLQDDVENREGLHRDMRARIVLLEEERSDFDYTGFESRLEVHRRADALQEQLDELAEAARNSEFALRASEDRWIRLIENHPEGVLVCAGRRIRYVNEAAVSILGARNSEDVIGTDILRYSPTSMHEQLSERIAAVEAGETQDPIEYAILGLDGAERFVEAFGIQIVFQGAIGVQVVIRDITERRNAERELRKYAERLAVVNEIEKNILVEKKPGEIADHALAHLVRLVPCHRAFVLEHHSNSGESEVLSSHAQTGVSTLQSGNTIRSAETSSPNDASESVEPRLVKALNAKKDRSPFEDALIENGIGSYYHAPLVVKGHEAGALIVGCESGECLSPDQFEIVTEIADLIAVGMHQHMTEQERLSYEIELITAKDRAEEMVRLKTAFLTNMSHEIRTPLTGIIGFAQILGEEISDEHGEFVNLIEQSGRRLLDTINSVLDLARLESNRMQMTLEPINIAEEARRSVLLLSPLAAKRDLWLKLDCPDDEIWLELDSAGLDRIFNNLVGNAIKFTTTGGIIVRVRKGDESVELSVRDTGIGMSEKFIPMLFEEFRQESSGADRSHEGSGMGLSITRKLVEIMGGTIGVESRKGVGTTFTVRFPTTKVGATLAPDRPPVHGEKRIRDRPVILVIEDQEESRYLLQYILHDSFDIRLAPDMAVATEIARSTDIDAVLLDVNLGGKQAAMSDLTRFRKTGTLTDVPIIGMTSYPWQGDRDALMRAGYSEYIARAFEKEILLGILETFVGSAGSAQAVGSVRP